MKNAIELVDKYNNAKLHWENHLPIWPLCDERPLLTDKRENLFSILDKWKLVGYCEAPFKSEREYNDALVFEVLVDHDHHKVGEIYWIHCKLEDMNFNIKKSKEK